MCLSPSLLIHINPVHYICRILVVILEARNSTLAPWNGPSIQFSPPFLLCRRSVLHPSLFPHYFYIFTLTTHLGIHCYTLPLRHVVHLWIEIIKPFWRGHVFLSMWTPGYTSHGLKWNGYYTSNQFWVWAFLDAAVHACSLHPSAQWNSDLHGGQAIHREMLWIKSRHRLWIATRSSKKFLPKTIFMSIMVVINYLSSAHMVISDSVAFG